MKRTLSDFEAAGKRVMSPIIETAFELQEARLEGNVGKATAILIKQMTFFTVLILCATTCLVLMPFIGTYRTLKEKYAA